MEKKFVELDSDDIEKNCPKCDSLLKKIWNKEENQWYYYCAICDEILQPLEKRKWWRILASRACLFLFIVFLIHKFFGTSSSLFYALVGFCLLAISLSILGMQICTLYPIMTKIR